MTAASPATPHNPDSAFELYIRIEPVSLTYGHSEPFTDRTFTSAADLLKTLHELGRTKTPLRWMQSEHGYLNWASLGALNVYLEHVYGKKSLNWLRAGELHRFAWREIQRKVGLGWTPLSSPQK